MKSRRLARRVGLKGAIITAAGVWVAAWACVLLAGCGGSRTVDPAVERTRNIALSRQLNARGMAPDATPEASIELFSAAVKADPFNGAAHNNLGAALLARKDYYQAARHFEQAIRLLPAHPDPRVNLGLLYESAGQLRNAQEQYEEALVVSPEYLPAIQPLARVRVRSGQRDDATVKLLRTISFRSNDPAWREWALKELTRAGVPEFQTNPPAAPATRPVGLIPSALRGGIA